MKIMRYGSGPTDHVTVAKEFAQLLIDKLGEDEVFRFEKRFQAGFRRGSDIADYLSKRGIEEGYLAGYLPDAIEASHDSFIARSLICVYDILEIKRMPVADPALGWIVHPAVKATWIAKQLGVSDATFTKKLKEIGYNKFSDEEIIKLAHIREQLIEELRPSGNPI